MTRRGPEDRRVVALVIRREVVERLRARSFRLATGLLGLVAMAGVIIPHLVSDGGRTRYDVGLVGTPADTAQSLVRSGDLIDAEVRSTTFADEASAEAALRSGRINAAVIGIDYVVVRKSLPASLEALLDQAVSTARATASLTGRGMSPDDAAALLHPTPLPVHHLERTSETNTANRSLAFAGSLFLYLGLLSFGMVVANGVVEEKSTRVSEVLLGAMRPSQLLAGKVLGIGVVGAVQVMALGLPAGVVALVLGSLGVPAGTPLTFAAIGMWFLLGFAFYSCAYAAAGASVSRAEEVGNATLPLTLLLLVGYLIGISANTAPDTTLSRVTSFLPPLAPMVMVSRAAVGHVARWEVPMAVAIELAATWVLIRFAGRVYTGAIVRTGPRVKLREAWRSAGR